MKREHVKSLIFVGFLLIVTGVCMGSLNGKTLFPPTVRPPQDHVFSSGNGPLTVSGRLVQDKIFTGSDGTVALALTMQADDLISGDQTATQHVDMVIVLDQSGSMSGQKIEYAKQAVLNLLSSLSAQDRVALIGYADSVWQYTELIYVTDANREELQSLVYQMSVGGSTNLGGGLQEGIDTLLASQRNGNVGKVILISDGIANRGITAPEALANIASVAVKEEFAISTVGVGHDFNEYLMTMIADGGAGNYYYLANPQAFAEIFATEFQNAKTVAAYGIEIRIPLPDGTSLVKASGFPITVANNTAVVHPGDLLSGQTRKLFLTFQIPTYAEKTYELSGINIQYTHQGAAYTAALSEPFRVACVPNEEDAVASIIQTEWEEKVLQEDFNALREQVAGDLKAGKQEEALKKIDGYYSQQQGLNDKIGSAAVTTNLNEDLDELRDFVQQTFTGSPQAVMEQQNINAKELQSEGYKARRSK